MVFEVSLGEGEASAVCYGGVRFYSLSGDLTAWW